MTSSSQSLFKISSRMSWRRIFRPDCVKNPCHPSGCLRIFALQGKKSTRQSIHIEILNRLSGAPAIHQEIPAWRGEQDEPVPLSDCQKGPPQEFRARRREISSDRFSRGMYVGKTLCTERASSCTPKAYSEAQSGVKACSKKRRSHFFDMQRGEQDEPVPLSAVTGPGRPPSGGRPPPAHPAESGWRRPPPRR